MVTRSLHFKVTVWYTLALAAILFVFSTLIYQNYKYSLLENLDSLLKAKAENVEDLIAAAVKPTPASRTRFLQAVQSTVQEEREDTSLVQIFDPQGRKLADSNKDIAENIRAPAINGLMARPDIRMETVKRVLVKGRYVDLRELTMPVFKGPRPAYIIQVAGFLTPTLSMLHNLKTILFLFLPLVLFFAVLVGFYLTKMALDPVSEISKTMDRISTRNLQERIRVPGADQEIKLLADTFNAMLERLDRAFSAQKQFIQDISHELKTPLTAMRGKQEVALEKERSSQEYKSVLQVNLEEIEKMGRLVGDLLVLISIDNQETFFRMGTVDLAVLIRGVVDNIAVLAQQKEIRLNASLQEGIFIYGDATQISRVVLNLLDNAIKYTPGQGDIGIKLYQEGPWVKIAVANSGPGIEKDELPRIFDRFYRTDKSRSSPGFGLGLSIAKSIVEAHQGQIEVKSQVGRKTVFIIAFPLSSPRP
ncbi:MAG: heavy metal sensor histidine kinase [Candidatus Omnitrophica bacterium]|nr:heavy metal sensor histidine kinase [Candidatus Omnitrophota bacterium]MDE2213759.1 heavy metal sensor histidine kinase [Candidatus Omnitrophota bacterium]